MDERERRYQIREEINKLVGRSLLRHKNATTKDCCGKLEKHHMKKQIRVAAAIIYRDGQFLLSKRKSDQHQGGKWEFPGGKIEAGETVDQAMHRELCEEINIRVSKQSDFHQLDFEYPEKHVSLYFQLVTEFSGQEQGLEGQEVAWFNKAELLKLTFPDANVPVLEKIEQLF